MREREHISELGWWRVAQRNADPRLRAYVHGYFGSVGHLPKLVLERHLPSTEVAFLLNFAAPPHRRTSSGEPRRWINHDRAWVVGLTDGHQLSEAVGTRHFMAVRFTPPGAHLFLGIPMHLISRQSVELDEFDPKLARLIASRVGAAESWGNRFDAMESLISERIERAGVPGAVTWSWNKIARADGRIALGHITSEIECSHRTLIAQFRTYVGLPPKTIARLFRFNRAVRTLNGLVRNGSDEPTGRPYIEIADKDPRNVAVPWADIAAECGYFDQPHLIKEFQRFAGTTPAGFLQKISDVD